MSCFYYHFITIEILYCICFHFYSNKFHFDSDSDIARKFNKNIKKSMICNIDTVCNIRLVLYLLYIFFLEVKISVPIIKYRDQLKI